MRNQNPERINKVPEAAASEFNDAYTAEETHRIGKNRLLLKTYIYFTIVVLIVVAMIAAIFLNRYQETTRAQYKAQLEEQAASVSTRFREYINDEDYFSCLSYLEILSEFGGYEVWSVANPEAEVPMDRLMTTMEIQDITQESYRNLIYSAFQGKERFLTIFSDIHGCTMMSVGVPIIGKGNKVCGALLINTSMEALDIVLQSSKILIFGSIVAALFVSAILAYIFARQLTKPVQEIRDTALSLADGQYEKKTGIWRNDEIGELAWTIDFLADKLAENEKIRKSLDQMRFDFFANVSHELRTPITVVRAYTESLVDGIITNEDKVHQYYERILSECKSMERLVGDLLLLSKMQNPDFQVEKEPVNLVQIFEEIVRSAGTIGKEKNIRIKLDYEKDLYMMYGDYDRLRQMFLVIFDNAVKFSPENSSVYVTIRETEKETVAISIRDEGIGISAEELPSIFDKFYKSKLRQNAKGTGLGLAIARQIALKHEGNIQVNSEVGKGTEFIFTFHMMSEEELKELME